MTFAGNSWKKQLAADVARYAKMSSNRADFEALLWRCGVACDIGNKSILFTIQPGVYGLAEERKCSNWKLISYGNFSGENILKTLKGAVTWKSKKYWQSEGSVICLNNGLRSYRHALPQIRKKVPC